jgi:hypothetical protein
MKRLLLAMTLLAGCGGDPTLLRGAWHCFNSSGDEAERYQFRPDGTYDHGKLDVPDHLWDAGTYTVEGNVLKMEGNEIHRGDAVHADLHWSLFGDRLWLETLELQRCAEGCD